MKIWNLLQQMYPGRVKRPRSVEDIPTRTPVVYILAIGQKALIVGKTSGRRARVIFDTEEITTSGHIKAPLLRIHTLYHPKEVRVTRYVIPCRHDQEARTIERAVQGQIGGNIGALPPRLESAVLEGLKEQTPAWLALKMALCSQFDGLSDLKKWRRRGILDDPTWAEIARRLKLTADPKPPSL